MPYLIPLKWETNLRTGRSKASVFLNCRKNIAVIDIKVSHLKSPRGSLPSDLLQLAVLHGLHQGRLQHVRPKKTQAMTSFARGILGPQYLPDGILHWARVRMETSKLELKMNKITHVFLGWFWPVKSRTQWILCFTRWVSWCSWRPHTHLFSKLKEGKCCFRYFLITL